MNYDVTRSKITRKDEEKIKRNLEKEFNIIRNKKEKFIRIVKRMGSETACLRRFLQNQRYLKKKYLKHSVDLY